ncbi:MAG: hypothetical protein ABF633_02830 [Clostridium sp.]|uniref:hypothetical protein n=1 Tax=Clostridium sp. TaxID=1506 RepID=UPI0039E790A8
MADNNSVGKISLDMELTSDLGKQIEQAANKIGDQLKASLESLGNLSFKGLGDNIGKQMTSSIERSMETMQQIIEQRLSKALEAALANMKAIRIPVEFDIPGNMPMPNQNMDTQIPQPRGPPAPNIPTSKMPKIDMGNPEVLKATIDNLAQSLDIVNAKIEQQQAKLSDLKLSYSQAFDGARKNKLLEQILNTEAAINKLTGQSDRLGFQLADLDKQFEMLGSAAKNAGSGMSEADKKIRDVGNSASKANTHMHNMSNSTKEMNNNMNHAYGGIGMFINSMFTWGLIFPMIIGGITSLGKFLGSTLMVNAQFANSLNQIKSNLYTAFMPIYEAILPALNSLMSSLATATAYIASFISQLFGKTYQQSFTAAQAMQSQIGAMTIADKQAQKAANSLGGVGKSATNSADATKKASKEIQGALAGFDQINKLQMNKDTTPKTPTPAGSGVTTPITPMANMAPIEAATSGWADRFKNILANLWKPFQQAWAAEGQNTINAARHALQGIEDLLGAIGRSFYIVWTNGTGERILVNLLKILQDILNIIGDIGVTFANAWNKGGIGTQVIQSLANALNNVLSLIDKMLQSVRRVWGQEGPTFANMFMQALQAGSGVIENITQKLGLIWANGGQHAFEGLVRLGLKVGELALFIFTNFVAPFVNWFVNMIAPAIAPVLNVLGKLFDKLSSVINWLMGSGKPILDIIIIVLGSFALAWGAVTIAIKAYVAMQNIVEIATIAMKTAIGFCTSTVGIWVIGIAAAIAIGILLYKNWDTIKAKATEVWNGVKNTFDAFKNWLGSVFSTDWSQKFGWMGDILNGFLANIRNIFNAVRQIFGGIIDFVAGVFTGNWSRAWQGVREIFDGIMSGLAAIVKSPLNAVISLVNAAIGALNRLHVTIPDWVPEFGGRSFGIDIPRIPYLAQGGIVDKPTTAMIGEAGPEAVVPLKNNTQGLNMLASMLSQRISTIQQPQLSMTGTSSSDTSNEINKLIAEIKELVEAIKNIKGDSPGGNSQPIPDINLDLLIRIGDTDFGKAVIKALNKIKKQYGRIPLDI